MPITPGSTTAQAKAAVGKLEASAEQLALMLRFQGPQEPLFDKSWVLPDVEKAN